MQETPHISLFMCSFLFMYIFTFIILFMTFQKTCTLSIIYGSFVFVVVFVQEKLKHQETMGEGVVGIWVRESPHNYENNSRLSEVFTCPSATKFTLEFDPRCHTERRCVCARACVCMHACVACVVNICKCM